MTDQTLAEKAPNKVFTFVLIFFVFIILGVIVMESNKADMGETVLPSFQTTSPTVTEPEKIPTPELLKDTPDTTTLNPVQDIELIFYYGITCPHCKYVEEYIEENHIEDILPIISKEVYEVRANSLDLTKKAQECGLDTRSIGVPFVYSNGKCFVGAPDSIAEIERLKNLVEKDKNEKN